MPIGSKFTLPQGGRSQFYIELYKVNFNQLLTWTANVNLTKIYRNGPWVVPYQNYSNGSDWLHKKVTGSWNRFSKCNCQKSSCLKLQGPEHSYMVYNIIERSSTNVVQNMPLGHNFTLNYMRKTFSLEPIMEIWPNSGPLPKLFKWFWLVSRKNVQIMPLV